VTTLTETTKLFALFWKNREAHCFHYFLTVSLGSQSEKRENSELLDSSETVKSGKKGYVVATISSLFQDVGLRIQVAVVRV
jgi:hypothetical protein